jgi:flagellar protein FlaG
MPAPTVQKSLPPISPKGAADGKSSPLAGGDLPPSEPPVSRADIERSVQRLNELMSKTQRSLHFQIDEISGRTVITVLDATTNEVVRQIPSSEHLAVLRHLERVGALLDTRC